MKFFVLILVVLFSQVNANASILTLFDGEGSPEQSGWTKISGAQQSSGPLAGTATEIQQSGFPNNSFSVETTGTRYHVYSMDTGYESFVVSMRVMVEEASHNLFDAGFMFAPLGSFTNPVTRINSIYIDPNQVGFMDESASFQVDANNFHDYFIKYDDKNSSIGFYIDSSFDEIKYNQVNPIFSKTLDTTGYENADYLPGVIVFGDQTNDLDVNSKYTLDYVKFEGIDRRSIPTAPVPEPATILLLGGGLAGAIWRRRMDSKV